MKSIRQVRQRNLAPRVVGFDDAPFSTHPRVRGSEVMSVGIVTSGDRFEGMLYVRGIEQDGMNAGDKLSEAIEQSKFHAQVHAVLLDGVTMGGLNVIDIQALATRVCRPVVAVMRSQPNIGRMSKAVNMLPLVAERTQLITNAGPVHVRDNWIFQFRMPQGYADTDGDKGREENRSEGVQHADVDDIAWLLTSCTPKGTQRIPECLRMAHMIGAAIKTGQSSSSA